MSYHLIRDKLIKGISPYFFREVLRIFYLKELLFKSNENLKCLPFLQKIVLKQILNAYRYPKKTVSTSIFSPTEILYAMKLNPFCPELMAGLFSKIGKSQAALQEAEAYGVPTEVCTFHRAALGYAFKNYFPKYIYHVATTAYCDNSSKTAGLLKHMFRKKVTVLATENK